MEWSTLKFIMCVWRVPTRSIFSLQVNQRNAAAYSNWDESAFHDHFAKAHRIPLKRQPCEKLTQGIEEGAKP